MAEAPPPPPGPDRIAGEDALHSGAEVGTGRFEQEMEMIPPDDITEHLPAIADDSALEGVDQPASVRIIAHDLLPRVGPGHDVIDGALKFDPPSPWHVGRLNLGETDGQAEKQETKSVTAHPHKFEARYALYLCHLDS
jgi:hypothetical protein